MPDSKDDIWSMITAKAYVDAPFRKRLTDNPREALREFDIDVPADLMVSVHVYDAKHWHIIVPPSRRKPAIGVSPPAFRARPGVWAPLRPVQSQLIKLAAPPRVPEKR